MMNIIELDAEVMADMDAIMGDAAEIKARLDIVKKQYCDSIVLSDDLLADISVSSPLGDRLNALEAAYDAAVAREAAAAKKYREDNRCGKCGGHGYIDAYNWNANGICFRCNGTGVE